MERSTVKITVVVGHEEKLVSGLTKRTTCEDVVKALLQEGAARAAGPPAGAHGAHCIVERWCGLDRVLPPKTKLLRLWTAWAGEQENVHFSLRWAAARRQGACPSAPRAAEAKVVKSKEGQQQQQQRRRTGPAEEGTKADGALQEKQRRMVRKAFRKLARINRKRSQAAAVATAVAVAAADRGPSPVERLETLVRVVLSQDQTIREQEERIRAVDEEIERHEAKIHMDRCEREGANYVQDAYLRGVDTEPRAERPAQAGGGAGGGGGGGEATPPCERAVKFEMIARLQDQLLHYEELAARLSWEIAEEESGEARVGDGDGAAGAETPRRPRGAAAAAGHRSGSQRPARTELLAGAERTGPPLEESSATKSGAAQAEMSSVERDLYRCQATLRCQAREYEYLSGLLSAMHVHERDAPSTGGSGGAAAPALVADKTPAAAAAAAPAAAPPCPSVETKGDANDNDSDTGLSSMHSQDSDTVLYMESLV